MGFESRAGEAARTIWLWKGLKKARNEEMDRQATSICRVRKVSDFDVLALWLLLLAAHALGRQEKASVVACGF